MSALRRTWLRLTAGAIAMTLEERLARGDADAIGEVYDLHHEHVRRFARRLLGDAASAEDLVQDVFVALPQAMRGFEGRCSLRTFLSSIAVNHAKKHVRSAARRRAAHERADIATRPDSARLGTHASDDPERLAARRELVARLDRALDALSLELRTTFVLVELEQLTGSEAARVLGIPEATVRTRVFEARRKLREVFAREDVQ